MSVVLSTHSVSLDGYMARTDGQAGRLNAWLFGSDERQPLHLSDESREVFDALVSRIGATVVGRNTYDTASGWDGMPPFDWPFFVVTHHPPENADEPSPGCCPSRPAPCRDQCLHRRGCTDDVDKLIAG